MRHRPLKGFRDFPPEEMRLRRFIESAWHAASRVAGFEEWDGPVLEPLELFTRKSGEEIAAQLYSFEDRGGRAVALRPEMTPTVVRMVAARAGSLPKPVKWYCVPQFFRSERPQRGRGREFYQWNVDVFGAPDPAADAEIIAVALDALRRLGFGHRDVVVRLSDRRALTRLLERLDIAPADHAAVMGCIDKLERDPQAAESLADLVGLRQPEILAACERFPVDCAPELEEVLAACGHLGVAEAIELDFRIVRGLAYYTGPVFEIFARGSKLRAVAGGGRYDALVEAMGGPRLEALGFGMGDMVVAELLAEKGIKPPDDPRIEAYVVPLGDEMIGAARQVVALLRAADVAAEAPYRALRIQKALRAADQSGARHAVIVGPDEWAERSVKVKDLEKGTERTLALDALAESL